MGLFSGLFGWISKLFKIGNSSESSSDESDSDKELKSEKEEAENIGSKLENIEAKLEEKEENLEAEESFEEAKLEEEEVELKEVEASISEEESAEKTGDSEKIASAEQHEKEEFEKLKKDLAELDKKLEQFKTDAKSASEEFKIELKEVEGMINEMGRIDELNFAHSNDDRAQRGLAPSAQDAEFNKKAVDRKAKYLEKLEKAEAERQEIEEETNQEIDVVEAEIGRIENELDNNDKESIATLRKDLSALWSNINLRLMSSIRKMEDSGALELALTRGTINTLLELSRRIAKRKKIDITPTSQ